MKITRRAGAVALAVGLGLAVGSAWPALANDNHGDRGGKHHRSDHHSPAWGLEVTDHGPAWGVRTHGHDFDLPVVLDDDVLGQKGWDRGVSAYGIDDASITGDNPVADAYLGQSGGSNSLTGWTNDRGGWLGGLLGDDGWGVVGGHF